MSSSCIQRTTRIGVGCPNNVDGGMIEKEEYRVKKTRENHLLSGYPIAVFYMRRVHDPLEGIHEDVIVLSVVVSPLKLIEIAIHVLETHLVKGADDRTL